jgi:hypothetical protein
LNALAADSIFWYASSDAVLPLASGPVFQTGNLSNSTSYWAESRKIRMEKSGPVVDFSSGDTLTVINTYHGVYLRVKKPMRIDSVVVHPSGPGILHFNLKDSANTILYKKVTVPVSGILSGEKIAVGIELSPGIYRVDGQNSTVPGLLRLNNFISYPIVSEGMDIIGASVPSRYYFFFDWRISLLECASQRKEVRAEIFAQPEAPVLTLSQNFVISSADTLQRWFKNGSFLGIFGDSIDALVYGNGTYNSLLITPDSCQAVSNLLPVLFTGMATAKGEIRFYPNPGQGVFNLILPGNRRHGLICLDATGKKVWEAETESGRNRLDFSFLPAGIYALVIRSDGESRVLRFRKED